MVDHMIRSPGLIAFIRRRIIHLQCIVMMLFATGMTAEATVFTLADLGQNSSLTFNSTTGIFSSWKVEGLENLNRRQWFFRVGAAGPSNPELALNASNLTPISAASFDLNGIPGNEFANAIYQGSLFRVNLASIVLTASALGSGQATFVESLRIDNISAQPLQISLFLYADYGLAGTQIDESAFFSDPRTLTQIDNLSFPGNIVHESSVTVTPTLVQVATGGSLLGLLTNAQGDDLSNVSALSGLADYEYGYQWTLNIAAGRSFTLGLTSSVTVPEATSVWMVGVAGIALLVRVFCRRDRSSTSRFSIVSDGR
jgi:hypothetical protein